MIHPARYLVSGACFVGVVVALFSLDYSERGRHFTPPTARAKTDRSGTYDLAKARTVAKVVGHIRSHYVDPSRIDAKRMVVAGLQSMQSSVAEISVEVERDKRDEPVSIKVTCGDAAKTFPLDKVGHLFALNWKLMDVFDFLERHLPPGVDLEELEYDAVNGVLSTLDPHSVLLPPRVYREMQVSTQGKFGGLGIVISMRDGTLTVVSVMEGTPAFRAGLESGDKVMQIGAESTVNMPLSDAVNRMRGEPGTEVTIWVKREGLAAPKAYPIVREEIRVRAVDDKDLGDGIGYIRLRSFQSNTFEDMQQSLEKLSRTKGGLKGLVLDLRENPGGLLDQAIMISDRFLADGTIVTTVRGGTRREERKATAAGTITDVPIVVLTNRGSASASEIVAGALKNNNRALVVGTTSFGKGSVQVVYTIDEAALKLTVAQYLTPGDISIQGTGIVPDIEIQSLSATKDDLDLHPGAMDRKGEARLKKSLTSEKTKDGVRPSRQLRLLEAAGDDKAKSDAPDALTTLARDLLKAAPAPDRIQQLVQAGGLLDRRQKVEQGRLTTALQGLGIDWSAGPAVAKPKLDVKLTIKRPEGATEPPKAGDEIEVLAQVTNRGTRSIHRLYGALVSSVGALNGEELVFGRLAPGASAEWTAKTRLPRSEHTTGDVVTVQLWSDDRELGKHGATPLVVQTLPRPRFAYTAQVLDPEGSKDGLIERGESVQLQVHITNVGAGPAREVLATIKNESGEDVFIKTGRVKLGELARGATTTATFELDVKASLKPRSVQLKLALVDQALRTWSHDDLSLPVFPKEFPRGGAKQGAALVGTVAAALHAGAHRDAPVVARAQPGARLAVVGEAGDWVQVAWSDASAPKDADRRAWVAMDQVTVEAAGAPAAGIVTAVLHHTPPELRIGAAIDRHLVTKQARLPIAGQARFDGGSAQARRRYVYIFRGEDKVFFQSAPTTSDDGGAFDFKAEVALEPGPNEIVVVAREGEGDVTRRRLTIHREE